MKHTDSTPNNTKPEPSTDADHRFRELSPGSFVYAMNHALDSSTCADMINRFEASPDQQYPGRIGQSAETRMEIKQSTDLRISGRQDWADIDQQLQRSLSSGLGLLAALHPFFKHNPLRDVGYNMQRTNPGEYYRWHIDGGPGEFAKRQLVAIWYLNDGPQQGGSTDFYFQDLSVRPEAGMLILFPPFWTHLHRGAEVLTQPKYIATTWVCVE